MSIALGPILLKRAGSTQLCITNNLGARNAMHMVRPVGKRFTAYHNAMSEKLGDEINCAKLPRVQVEIAVLESDS